MLGVTWFLMALGAFTRDVSHVMATIVPILMYATPIFYKNQQIAAVSPTMAVVMRLNIVGDYVEMFRDIALVGRLPNLFAYAIVVVLSYAVFLGGYRFFMRYKSVIVDVI
jgi:lipopolysaccharide transport system permease protein